MTTKTHRLLSLACAALLTMTILGGIDQLARMDAGPATMPVPALAAAPGARA